MFLWDSYTIQESVSSFNVGTKRLKVRVRKLPKLFQFKVRGVVKSVSTS